LKYLQSSGQASSGDAPTSELVQQVWRWESEFWQENDPDGDRFSKPLPGWCCFALLVIPVALGVVLVKYPAPLIGILAALLILWPVGVLAKRRAEQTDFRPR
jgi:hypothetical protein